jgi:hypothetical protein
VLIPPIIVEYHEPPAGIRTRFEVFALDDITAGKDDENVSVSEVGDVPLYVGSSANINDVVGDVSAQVTIFPVSPTSVLVTNL